jgi:S1-C subfamily serine protease
MIDQALAARASTPPAGTEAAPAGAGPATLKRAVGAAVARSTLVLKVVVGVLVLGLLGSAAYAVHLDRRREAERQHERERLLGEISALSRSLSEERAQTAEQLNRGAREREQERAQLMRQLESLAAQLGALHKGSPGETIAAENKAALWLLVGTLDGRETPFCTGFAIRNELLATNAHCVRAAEMLMSRGAQVQVVQNGTGKRLAIAKMSAHPAYRDRQLGSDVGILRVGGTLPSQVRLATREQLQQVRQGATMYTIGFPGHLANSRSPEATLTQGVVSRLMTFDRTPGAFEETRLIQHTAFISQGTSGSPIFDRQGQVIGVNSGGFTNRQPVGISGQSGQVIPVLITIASPGYNLAMRIDLVTDLLATLGER